MDRCNIDNLKKCTCAYYFIGQCTAKKLNVNCPFKKEG